MENFKHTILIGKFMLTAGKFAEQYKRGGKQKLHAIVGELFFQRGKKWFFDTHKICTLTCEELQNFISLIENKIK